MQVTDILGGGGGGAGVGPSSSATASNTFGGSSSEWLPLAAVALVAVLAIVLGLRK